MHPEERRIAGLLRELIVETGFPLEAVDHRLGWGPGQLAALLDGRERLTVEDLLTLLPELGTTPSEFFAWLYGLEAREPAASRGAENGGLRDPRGLGSQKVLDQRFEKSMRLVRSAMERRREWKKDRGEE
jgi:hypothetical protein